MKVLTVKTQQIYNQASENKFVILLIYYPFIEVVVTIRHIRTGLNRCIIRDIDLKKKN